MKIAVLTWKLHNYGTALQAFALVMYISKSSEYDCKLLNYSLPNKDKIDKVVPIRRIDLLRKSVNYITSKMNWLRNKKVKKYYRKDIDSQHTKFTKFYNMIPHDNHEVSLKESYYFNSTYDKVIVGADQVWNPKYFCSTYFLDFVADDKKFSYAPSLGVSTLKNEEKEYLKSKLSHFNMISIREWTGKRILEGIINKSVDWVVDPTLLFNKKQWDELLNLSDEEDEEYIFVYTLSAHHWYKNIINRIKEQLEFPKIIYVCTEDNLYFYEKESNIYVNSGPIEFVKLLRNARYIITDSFHGLCFSLIYEKYFTYLNRFDDSHIVRGENSRVIDLLNFLNIYDRFCKKNDKEAVCGKIYYEQINKRLNILRNNSIQYISKILKDN